MIKEKTIIKKDTLENWNKAKNFIPKDGEIIVYIDMGIKLGDGITSVNNLPFMNQNTYTVEGNTLIIENNEYRREE